MMENIFIGSLPFSKVSLNYILLIINHWKKNANHIPTKGIITIIHKKLLKLKVFFIIQWKIDKSHEQTFHKIAYSNGKLKHEKMFIIISH